MSPLRSMGELHAESIRMDLFSTYGVQGPIGSHVFMSFIIKDAEALLLIAASSCFGQDRSDWPTYGHDGGSTRFSSLTDIDQSNVAELKRTWTYHMAPDGKAGCRAPVRCHPVCGCAVSRRHVSWSTESFPANSLQFRNRPERVHRKASLGIQAVRDIEAGTRGVAFWAGDRRTAARVVFGTRNGFLVALNANSETLSTNFGNAGRVDLKPAINNGILKATLSMPSPPQTCHNVRITGPDGLAIALSAHRAH